MNTKAIAQWLRRLSGTWGIGLLGIALLGAMQVAQAVESCDRPKPLPGAADPTSKITFDLARLSPEGLVGQVDARRSLSYEFCIPATPQALAEVRAIDPTLQHSRSPGRIRCTRDQYLVIGETHKPNWRDILTQLTQRPYVQRIDEFFGE